MWKQSHTFFCSKTTKTCIFQLDLAAGFHAHFTSTACSCTSLYILWLRHVSSLLSIIHCQIFHNRDIRKRASPNCMNTYLQSFFIGRQQQGGTAFSYTARAFAFPVDFMNFKVKVTNIQSVFLQKYLKKNGSVERGCSYLNQVILPVVQPDGFDPTGQVAVDPRAVQAYKHTDLIGCPIWLWEEHKKILFMSKPGPAQFISRL